MRRYNKKDQLLVNINEMLNTLFVDSKATRPFPAEHSKEVGLNSIEKRRSASYMRVNHVGEVCAQALYQSQRCTAKTSQTKQYMAQAAKEEEDHLAWCEQRIKELGGRTSLLNPLWYVGSFTIGAAAGLAGEKWNLGFVAETEKQVVKHLEEHLEKLPKNDVRSQQVVAQMKQDEQRHAEQAMKAGAAPLPKPIKKIMTVASKIMTKTAYWI